MYIKKYWGNFIGSSDDSLNLVAFLEDQKKEEITLNEIFSKIGLDKQNWGFRQTAEYLEFTHSDGVEMDFHFAIDVITDLAAILLECSVSGGVNLHDLDEYDSPSRRIRVTATPEEHDAMDKALADFAQNPLEYDLSEMMDEDETKEMAGIVESLRRELHEAARRNGSYYVKAEDVKNLATDRARADDCIATNGDSDGGWRFTAGDDSKAHMDDPNNAGFYKLNTICKDAPDGEAQDEESGVPEVYTEDEMEIIEGHIEKYFGKFENVFHELVSPDIHVDICVVPPSEERDYYTLVTMGMGAHRMNVPEQLAEYKLERAELAIALPAGWKLDQGSMKDERWYWPIRLLKVLARLPIASDTWLGFGHTMDNKENFAKGTELCAAILTGPQGTEEGSEVCSLPGGEEVNFYQVIALYRDELEYKIEHDADTLLDKMAGISFVVNPTRQDAITRGTLADEHFAGDMDDADWHLESIQEKELPVDEINAYNHMAIYLRWCMEHDLMSVEFTQRYNEQYQAFLADIKQADLRSFIRDALKGQLFGALFNKEGAAFAGYYYGESDSPYFPSDVDDYALQYFGPMRYHSNEFQQEAYLFIPFDEDYYQAMAKVIEKRFGNWQGQDFGEDTLEPSDVARAIMEYLDCECTYFPSMADDDPIMSAYSYARRLGVREGFLPVLIKPDETLLECLVMNADPQHEADCYEFDLKTVAEYRKKMLAAPVKDGKAVLEALTGQRKEEAEDDDMDWEEEVLGRVEGGYENCRFSSYWDSDRHMTYPLILAKIPVKNPWEIFSYLPFGNWNECPDTPELMAAAKYWFEQYGAIPAAMSHDTLEFDLPTPVSKEKAMEVAAEQYGFCPDVVDQEQDDPTVGSLADVLRQSTVWYFWWD